VHEHFDADGNLTGTTVVTREPEWDDQSRGRALRLAEYEDGMCGCGCNQPVSVAYDKTQVFVVDKFTCYAGRAMEQVKRTQSEAAEQQKLPPGHDDGVHMYVRPHDPQRDKPLRPPTGGRP
jgi:hypothetical protein